MAFQLIDDVLDYNAREEELGKAVGDDFRDGKVTLPVVLAFAKGSDAERDFWRRCIEDLDQREGDLEQALGLMQRHGRPGRRHGACAELRPRRLGGPWRSSPRGPSSRPWLRPWSSACAASPDAAVARPLERALTTRSQFGKLTAGPARAHPVYSSTRELSDMRANSTAGRPALTSSDVARSLPIATA